MLAKANLSAETLASVLGQSADCIKLIGLDGEIMWMNENGMCAMDIDEFCMIDGQQWADTWPGEARTDIEAGLTSAAVGNAVRFDAFCPTAKGIPKYWNVSISRVDNANHDHAGYLVISRDDTEVVMARQAAEIAVDEMQHRIKNTYAAIGGLMMGYASGNPERQIFAREMHDRMVAISKAQTLFVANQAPCDIAELIPALIVPFANQRCTVNVADIAPIRVDQGRADAIALVLGELAVNAAKHGALAAGGSIKLRAGETAGRIEIIWDEQSVAPVTATTRDGGQGLKLITSIIRARGGTIDIAWHAHGPLVTLTFPDMG